ncbi:MAG: glycosyltransferase family 4 protein [Planctomycetaceae bacterium]|nr:glycosyltransferase family 4 protein [Planctomycetaceae bacterium]
MAKVAWLCEFPLAGGGDRSLLATLGGLRRAGFEPVALAPAGGELARLFQRHDVPQLPVQWIDSQGRRLAQPQARQFLQAQLTALRPDLLHANSLAMARLAGPVATELELPSLGHLRDIVGLSAAAMADVNRNARLLAVSQATRAFHVAQGLALEKSFVLYNGVDLRRFRPREPHAPRPLLSELELGSDALLIGCIGQIILRKGQERLLPLAQRLRADFPSAHLVIIGDCPSQKAESRAFDAQVRRDLTAAAPGQVHFLGRRDDVETLLPQLDLLVHPARQEPLGRVLLEAAACGLPIVATPVGGTREIFAESADPSALLIDTADGSELAAAVARLLDDPDGRTRLGGAARRRAESVFDVERAATGLATHYAEVLALDREADGRARRQGLES